MSDFAYFNVREPRTGDDVYKTLEIGSAGLMLVDLDANGRVLGVEMLGIGTPDWLTLLADDRCRFHT